MTDAPWLGFADLDQITEGMVLEARWQGLTMTGVAHHQTDGAWFTFEGGLLVPAIESVRFRCLRTTLSATPGTIVWVKLTNGFEGALEYTDKEFWQTREAKPRVFWRPGDPPLAALEWQLIRGEVAPA